MSAKYRLPVTVGQNWPTQQSHVLYATAKLLITMVTLKILRKKKLQMKNENVFLFFFENPIENTTANCWKVRNEVISYNLRTAEASNMCEFALLRNIFRCLKWCQAGVSRIVMLYSAEQTRTFGYNYSSHVSKTVLCLTWNSQRVNKLNVTERYGDGSNGNRTYIWIGRDSSFMAQERPRFRNTSPTLNYILQWYMDDLMLFSLKTKFKQKPTVRILR